jgi:putative FmdB family regulatory protein
MILAQFVPTYEYECPRCPRVFEVRQRITEPALTRCDRCGGPIHRLLSATPFILKGRGWYVTDYPSESRKKAMGGDAPAPPAADSKAPDAKGDAKGEAKPESKGSDSSSKEGKAAESKAAESKPPKSKSSHPKSSAPAAPSSGSGSPSGGSSPGGAKKA